MNADPEVMRFSADGHACDRSESAATFARLRGHWDEHGFGRWAVERRDDGAVLGFAGLGFPRGFPTLATIPEIGWRLARPHWGQGYTTEAAIASRDDLFRTFSYESILSLALPGNTASIRIMEKLGFRRDGEVAGGGGRIVWIHRLDRADWRAAA